MERCTIRFEGVKGLTGLVEADRSLRDLESLIKAAILITYVEAESAGSSLDHLSFTLEAVVLDPPTSFKDDLRSFIASHPSLGTVS